MTLSELKKKIAESDNADWFQSRQLNLNCPHINYSIHLEGFVGIYDFLLKQISRFDEFPAIPDDLKSTRTRFNTIKIKILELVSKDTTNDYEWKNILNQINGHSIVIFPADAPETEFLVRLNQDHPEYVKGAYDFFSGSTSSPTNKSNLIGYIMAYEFLTKDSSKIVERKDAEKKSISRIRTEFQQQLSDSETHLTEYLSNANQKVIEKADEIDKFLLNKKDGYQQWFDETSGDFSSYYQRIQENVKELEDLYKQKLKLEAPAKYWNDRAKKLRTEGYWWLLGLILCIGVGVVVLIWVLSKIADGTLTQLFASTATAIKWSIALITLISFIAYAIRVISKLTFSSFHLVRDAEEREQLTYVYLALQREKGVDQTERHLIMQSLFSRADSGLLKDDASPTMPGNIVDKLMSK